MLSVNNTQQMCTLIMGSLCGPLMFCSLENKIHRTSFFNHIKCYQLNTAGFFQKEICRFTYSVSKLNKQPSSIQSSISCSLHYKNTLVPLLWREHDVPIFCHFKFSIQNHMDCHQFIQAFIFSLFRPLSCFFFT